MSQGSAPEDPASAATADRIVYEQPVELGPRIRRLTQRNPGLFTGPGTNTFLVASGDGSALIVLEPGEDTDEHSQAIVQAVGRARVLAIAPSHSHRDHWPLAPRLASHFGAPTCGFAAREGFRPDRLLRDGEKLAGPGIALTAIHTPGHASDHLCYLLDDGATLFSGDHVMGWSTSIISPPDGDLRDYLRSLEKLLVYEVAVLHSAHGPAISRPRQRIVELYEHRQERTRQALAALGQGDQTIPEMVRTIYTDVDLKLHPAAQRSLLAHLLMLHEQRRVEIATPSADPMAVRYRLAPHR